MADYAGKGFERLSHEDWKKVEALRWPRLWREEIPRILKTVLEKGSVPEDQRVQIGNTLFGTHHVGRAVNLCFRQARLPYRFFKTEYGGDAYTVGIVKPIRRKSRKLKKSARRSIAVSGVIKAARVFLRKQTSENASQLRKALKNPDLPS